VPAIFNIYTGWKTVIRHPVERQDKETLFSPDIKANPGWADLWNVAVSGSN
jgi:hypothetical protein